ncbi:hypothetical protein Taro_033173, partial [Colocasia esculenta]|nr:hypothetical protein [Colocasia esculenta]
LLLCLHPFSSSPHPATAVVSSSSPSLGSLQHRWSPGPSAAPRGDPCGSAVNSWLALQSSESTGFGSLSDAADVATPVEVKSDAISNVNNNSVASIYDSRSPNIGSSIPPSRREGDVKKEKSKAFWGVFSGRSNKYRKSVTEWIDFTDLTNKEPWLSSTRLVIKLDILFGKRKKSGSGSELGCGSNRGGDQQHPPGPGGCSVWGGGCRGGGDE